MTTQNKSIMRMLTVSLSHLSLPKREREREREREKQKKRKGDFLAVIRSHH